MKDKNSRGRFFERQVHLAEVSIKRAQEEEAKIKTETDQAKTELIALDKERNELEKKLLKVKMDIGSVEEGEEIS